MDLQIESRNVSMTPGWREEIEASVAGLEAGRGDMTHARVTLSKNEHKKADDMAEALVVVQIPGRTITARKQEETFERAIRSAFEAIETELEKYRDKRASHEVRVPPVPVRGVISKVFQDEGYGFILQEGGGEEVYFHRNAVHDMKFEELEDGMEVSFNVEIGEKGPQATTVDPLPVTDYYRVKNEPE
ncbi:MAG TPA: HPF/RaiA family ribosome-associated protein [Nitrospiraceae bacterium]|nr:HPF/RaiA family ribosome-associated protein [Nitrospiraceae bacterium]